MFWRSLAQTSKIIHQIYQWTLCSEVLQVELLETVYEDQRRAFYCQCRSLVLSKVLSVAQNLLLFSRSYVQSPILGSSLHSQANLTTRGAELNWTGIWKLWHLGLARKFVKWCQKHREKSQCSWFVEGMDLGNSCIFGDCVLDDRLCTSLQAASPKKRKLRTRQTIT
jgi:hypothetical protein